MAAKKVSRPTWQEPPWSAPNAAPAPFLLTRDEVLRGVTGLGLDADERDLRYWEAEGILPRPVRQRYQGATRATYPSWFIDLIYKLRRLQGLGLSLKELPSRLRAESFRLSREANAQGHPHQPPASPGVDGQMGLADFMLTSGLFERAVRDWFIASLPTPRAAFPSPADPIIIADGLAQDLARVVNILATVYAEEAGIEIAHGELHLIDKHGRALLPLPIPLDEGGGALSA